MSDPLRPFSPSSKRPWSARTASHLLRRGGFAPNPQERDNTLAETPAACVDRLIDHRREHPRFQELDVLGERLARGNDIVTLRGWWLMRLRYTARPLVSRMTLFWHDLFATSNQKVASASLMLRQMRLFERHALGRFEDLLMGVMRDPAMIVWLDGERNVKGRPNENFAREFFELFTLGVGHYTEPDIREAARAFTGWRQRNGRSELVARNHDRGEKVVLGERGPLDADDIVRLALRQPACSRFLAAKLLREFVTPRPGTEEIETVATRLRETSFDIAATLRTLLSSELMFDPRVYRARIKSPVEFVMSVARPLDLRVSAPVLAETTDQMGQRLFEPPSVKGWDGHRSWLNSATMLVRLNSVTAAVLHPKRFDSTVLLEELPDRETKTIIDDLCTLTLDGEVPSALRRDLMQLEGSSEQLIRAALRLLMSSPEFQLA